MLQTGIPITLINVIQLTKIGYQFLIRAIKKKYLTLQTPIQGLEYIEKLITHIRLFDARRYSSQNPSIIFIILLIFSNFILFFYSFCFLLL